MANLHVAVANAQDRFAEHGDYLARRGDTWPPRIDMMVVPEAWRTGTSHPTLLRGYENYILDSRPYDDPDNRADRHDLAVLLSPDKLTGYQWIQLAGRAAIVATFKGGFEVVGAHFDDRTEHRRLLQARAFLERFAGRAVLMGDLNAMHGDDRIAEVLRVAGGNRVVQRVSDRLPIGRPGEPQNSLARRNSLGRRLVEMADGSTLALLKDAGYTDADPLHQATKSLWGVVAVQLDHIMLPSGVRVVAFQCIETDGVSDHAMLRAHLCR